MAHSFRTRCDSKVSPVRLAGDWSKISMDTDWIEKSTKRDGPSSGWLVKSGKFNSLEITRVASKRFLGLPYASVSAHSRHIQENEFLLRAKDHQEWDRAKLKAV